MQATIEKSPNAIATFQLEAGESLFAAPNRLFSHSAGVSLRSFFGLSYQPRELRLVDYLYYFIGFLRAFFQKIFFGADTFWHIYHAPNAGRVSLTPSLPGEITALSVRGRDIYFQQESFLACTAGVSLQRAPRSSLLSACGDGTLYVSGFGEIAPIDVEGSFEIDLERLVAVESSLSLRTNQKTLELFGKGKLWVQTGKPSRVMNLRTSW